MRAYAMLLVAGVAGCGGRWDRVSAADPRVLRPGATLQLPIGERIERVRVLEVTPEAWLVRRQAPCDSCEVRIARLGVDSVTRHCAPWAGGLIIGSMAALGGLLWVAGSALDDH